MPSFNYYIKNLAANRHVLQSVFFFLALISLYFNFKHHILLHQIGKNPIVYQEIDPAYWAFMILNITGISGTVFSVLLDALLTASCIASIIWNKQNIAPFIFFICHFIYFILYNMMAGHHYSNIGLLIMSFPFIFCNHLKFGAAFSFCRFLFCFMLFSAGLWKVVRGNLFYPDQMHMLLISGHLSNFLVHDASISFQIKEFFITHKIAGHLLWVATIAIELLFFLGFTTLKKDKLLLIAYLLFAIGGWFFLNIYNYENALFLLTLTPVLSLIITLNKKRLQYFKKTFLQQE